MRNKKVKNVLAKKNPIFIQKWGNSAAIRLTSKLLHISGLNIGQQVEVSVKPGILTITPVVEEVLDLDFLISQITPTNQHTFID